MRWTIQPQWSRRLEGRSRLAGQVAATVLIACALPPALGAQDAARRCLVDPPDRAIASCRDAVRLSPDDLVARRSLATALTARGDTLGAVDEFREITRRDPTSAQAQLDLATALDRAGRSDDALRAYRRYLELDPSEPRAHELVGWLLLQKARVAEALAEFRAAQRLAPHRGAAYHGAGIALVALGRREEALRSLNEAGRLSPEDAAIWGETAVTSADLGRDADALSAWDRALRVDPSYFDRRPAERKRWATLSAKAPSRVVITPSPQPSASVARSTPTREAPRSSSPARGPAGPLLGRRNGPDASGSGFIITTDGHIVTNRHVVTGCQSVGIRADSSTTWRAKVVAVHPRDDLAVLQADGSFGTVAAFRVGSGIRPGDDIVAVGFPLAGLLADEPSVTTGSVSALAGIHNDPSILQMSAPVQQGSSGGPLFDASGNVVGVVVTKLNARIVAEETGDMPQNVNFALKSDLARTFLDELSIRYRTAPPGARLSNADVGDIGRRVTVMVECYR
jgi:S1-C subfamily serine protease